MKLKNLLPILCTICLLGTMSCSDEIEVKRLNGGEPIISQETFLQEGYNIEEGDNINGPCLVKLPEWLDREKRVDPEAEYYLYFAHHHGKYIRLAWAAELEGPYTLAGDSPYYGSGKDAVFCLDENRYFPMDEMTLRSHVASPYVVIDNEQKLFKLYFHAPVIWNEDRSKMDQQTFFATSETGLDFKEGLVQEYLGRSYFSTFTYKGREYAFANCGSFYQAPESSETVEPAHHDCRYPVWMRRDDFFEDALKAFAEKEGKNPEMYPRHLGPYVHGDQLYVFFSCKKDMPEQLYYTTCDLSAGTYEDWKAGEIHNVLKAESEWEGGLLPPTMSMSGSAKRKMNDLRDPFIYEENGKLYLLYSGGGEKGIGIASVQIR